MGATQRETETGQSGAQARESHQGRRWKSPGRIRPRGKQDRQRLRLRNPPYGSGGRLVPRVQRSCWDHVHDGSTAGTAAGPPTCWRLPMEPPKVAVDKHDRLRDQLLDLTYFEAKLR